MKQISTGAGLLGLGVCMVATAFIARHRGGSEAFAQVTGGERRIVYTNLISSGGNSVWSADVLIAYRVWSDNTIDIRPIGTPLITSINCGPGPYQSGVIFRLEGPQPLPEYCQADGVDDWRGWRTVDDGTETFLRADIDRSRMVDAGDISSVLVEYGQETGDPPPPIDCTINAPR